MDATSDISCYLSFSYLFLVIMFYLFKRQNSMVQQVKFLINELNSIPETHLVWGENQLP